MNDPQRAELLEAITELGRRYPDWRFGQLIANVADWTGQTVWDAEDEQLLATARAHLTGAAIRQQRATA